MEKSKFIFILCVLACSGAFAQQNGTVYYLTRSGSLVSTKDSADFFLVIQPPDSSTDKNLFIIKEYYPNGKIRLIAGSETSTFPLKLQGSYITFFPNGHKMSINNFEGGKPVGDIIEYYPNGKFYDKKSYIKDIAEEPKLKLRDCSDSSGRILAENGNGKWIKYNDDFTKIIGEGQIENGLEEGDWSTKKADSTEIINEYKNGKIVSNSSIDKSGNRTFYSVEVVPEFPGGINAFYNFLNHNVRYPANARENGTQGRVIISFIVEKDGSLDNMKVVKGIGDGCSEEAMRVIKLSSPWKAGTQDGKPVRVLYNVPVSFTLGN